MHRGRYNYRCTLGIYAIRFEGEFVGFYQTEKATKGLGCVNIDLARFTDWKWGNALESHVFDGFFGIFDEPIVAFFFSREFAFNCFDIDAYGFVILEGFVVVDGEQLA